MQLRLLPFAALLWLLLTGTASAQQFPEQPGGNPLRGDAAPQEQPSGAGSPQPTADSQQNPPSQSASPAGQETAEENEEEGLTDRRRFTSEEIQTRLDRLKDLQLSEADAASARQHYADALQATAAIKRAEEEAARDAKDYTPQTDGVESKGFLGHAKDWYEQRLAVPIEDPPNAKLTVDVDLKQAETSYLEERATARENNANKWTKRVKDLETQPAIRKQFLSSVPTARQQLEQQLAAVSAELGEINDITNEVTNARMMMLTQQAAKLQAEIAALEAKRKSFERAQEVHELELELAKRKAAYYTEALAAVRSELSDRRKRAASQQIQSAEQAAERNKALIERNPNTLGRLAAFNQALTQEIKQLGEQYEEVVAERAAEADRNVAIGAKFKEFESSFGDDSKLSQASGQLLRDQRSKLPRISQLWGEELRRTAQKNDLAFRRFTAAQRQTELEDIDAQVADVLEEVRPEDRKAAEPVVREMLTSQSTYLKNYVKTLDDYEKALGDLIATKLQLRETTQQFRDFIAQRDLWIRSCGPLWASDIQLGQTSTAVNWRPFYFEPAMKAVAWSLSPANWMQAVRDLRDAAYREPFSAAMLILAFVLLLYAQHNSRQHIKTLGGEASKKTCTEFLPSLRTLWLTIVVSLPWPLLLWGIGWMLSGPLNQSDFSLALSQSTRTAGWVLLLAEFMRQCCRGDGLADAHLGWPRAAMQQLRRYLRWVPIVIVPLVFWFVGLDVQTTEQLFSASLGRVLFLVVMGYAAFALYRLLMVHGSAIYQVLDRGSDSWLLRLHRVWRPVLVMLPVVLAVMASVGYYYTAEQLAKRVLATAAMLLLLMIAGGLLRRWVLLNRRQLAREQARQRRAAAQAAAEAAQAEGGDAPPMVEMPEETVDLTALSEATRKLLGMLLLIAGIVGAVMIWQEVFPALAWLDKHALPGLGESDDPTTWGDLLRCLLTLVITYVATRDIPALLELVVLQHLPIDQGARYAISTLARYALLTAGIIIAGYILSIGSSLGWLVAAMGVGLGFGLQEIFANFVSGIILLFERPIRVGDIITLGEKTGIVNRIRMRATTIVDWDRKEYVVPNKDLVTERLLNWTLSDQLNRIVIEVGVAYGTDIERALLVLREVIDAHPETLTDPAPIITFEGFGDSTLNLVVRCYLPSLEKRIFTISELHVNINKRFRDEGIEIAFPQRDLHLRSVPAGWERSSPGDGNDRSATNGHHTGVAKTEANPEQQ